MKMSFTSQTDQTISWTSTDHTLRIASKGDHIKADVYSFPGLGTGYILVMKYSVPSSSGGPRAETNRK